MKPFSLFKHRLTASNGASTHRMPNLLMAVLLLSSLLMGSYRVAGASNLHETQDNAVSAQGASGESLTVSIECGRLVLRVQDPSPDLGCLHQWDLINFNNQVCQTVFGSQAIFYLDNLDTETHPFISVRHTKTCSNQPPVVSTTVYNFPTNQQGIFVNTTVVPSGEDEVSVIGISSCLNGYQPLFPSSYWTSNHNVYITGILKATGDANYTYVFNNIRFFMAPEAGIDAIRKVNFDYCTFRNACGTAWRGIKVFGQSLNNDKVKLAYCNFRGAIYGINPVSEQVRVELKKSTFTLNYITVMAQLPFDLDINDCTFSSGTNLPALGNNDISAVQAESGGHSTLSAFCALYLENFTDIGTDPIPNLSKNSTYNVFPNGIYAVNSNISFKLNTISNCTANFYPGAVSQGNGIYFRDDYGSRELEVIQTNLYTCLRGIYAVTMDNGCIVDIHSNNIGNDYYGIVLEQQQSGRFALAQVFQNNIDTKTAGVYYAYSGSGGASYVTIATNTFMRVNGGDGILLKGPNPGSNNVEVYGNTMELWWLGGDCGIHLHNFSGAYIHDNTIDLPSYNGDLNCGIWLSNSTNNRITLNKVTGKYVLGLGYSTSAGLLAESSTSNMVENNIFTSLGKGLEFHGDCTMENMLRCNTIANCSYGMQFGKSSLNPVGYIGSQINTGNRWADENYMPGLGLIGAVNYGDQTQLDLSRFETQQGNSQEYPQTFELQSGLDPNTWFFPGSYVGCAAPPAMRPLGTNDRAEQPSFAKAMGTVLLNPNPADDHLRVKFNAFSTSPSGELNLLDAAGRVVYSVHFEESVEIRVPLTNLPDGIYVCRIATMDQAPITQKVVVQH